jgi:hypothetical protein
MTRTSQALIVYDPKMANPPFAFQFMEMLHELITYEKSFQHPLHPHQVHDIVVELRCMFCTMHYLSDWTLLKRVTTLLQRARVKIFHGCHEYLLRCAVLVDACRIHQHSLLCKKHQNTSDSESAVPTTVMPTYDSLSLAVAACDDVLVYLVPSMKQFYIYDLRPSLVAFMQDTESDSSDCESDRSILAGLPEAKRACLNVPP